MNIPWHTSQPTCHHICQWVDHPHESKIHGRPNQFPIKSKGSPNTPGKGVPFGIVVTAYTYLLELIYQCKTIYLIHPRKKNKCVYIYNYYRYECHCDLVIYML